jgi:peptide deformylase
MPVLPIITYPDSRLRAASAPVAEITPEVRRLADDLAETMYFANAAGLSAPQVGVGLRVVTIDLAENRAPAELYVFINPRILSRSGTVSIREGCMSLPGVNEPVERAAEVTVHALGLDGQTFTLDAKGLMAVAVQHELDHLDGVLVVDHLSHFAKRRVDRALVKRSRQRA